MSNAEVVRVKDEHADVLAGFLRHTWDPDATAESVLAGRRRARDRNPHGAGQDIPTFLFLLDGKAIGHLTTIPFLLSCSGREIPAHWMKGFWVLPEHQNGPVGFMLIKEAIKQLGCSMASVVQQAPRRLFEKMGYKDLGTLSNSVRVLNAAHVLGNLDFARGGLGQMPSALNPLLRLCRYNPVAQIAGRVADFGLSTLALARARPNRELSVMEAPLPAADEVDDLWRHMREGIDTVPFRDTGYMTWRYATSGSSQDYRFLAVRSNNSLVALVVVRPPGEEIDARFNGLRVATVSDILCSPMDRSALIAAMAGAEHLARQLGADALLCSASHDQLQRVIRSRMFLEVSGSVHIMLRDPAALTGNVSDLEHWWLTRGDGYSD